MHDSTLEHIPLHELAELWWEISSVLRGRMEKRPEKTYDDYMLALKDFVDHSYHDGIRKQARCLNEALKNSTPSDVA